jgi:YHS domain-containing protein
MKKNLKNGLAVRGYDLVSIVNESNATKGSQAIDLQFEGANYWFKSEENKQLFIDNPKTYLPQYGGYCAIAMSEGALVDANPKSFIRQDNKLYIFFSKYAGMIDTKRQWAKNPKQLQKLADLEWKTLN